MPHHASHLGNYVFHNAGTSQAFRDAVEDGINSIPVPIHEALALERCSIVTGDRLTAFLPQLVGLTPPGYPPGATYDWARGVFDDPSRAIAVPASYYDFATGRFEPNDAVEGHLRHEVGHALFAVLHGVQADVLLVSAYAVESQAITDPLDLALLDYYLRLGNAGLEETFAEAFAIIHGGGADSPTTQACFVRLFHQTIQAITHIIQGI